jgi:hypothetical protein
VARIPRAEADREMAAQFQSHMAAFEHRSDESRADVVNVWVPKTRSSALEDVLAGGG